MRSAMNTIATETESGRMVMLTRWKTVAVQLLSILALLLTVTACAELEQRDKRFYYRALWNFALREDLKELDIDFNGIDFGHTNLYEHLLMTGAADVRAIEDQARADTLRFIRSRPELPPNEEAIAPTY